MSPGSRSRRPSLLLLLILVAALGVGAAAVALESGGTGLPSGTISLNVSTPILFGALFLVLAAGIGWFVYHRLTDSTRAIPGRFFVWPLIFLLLLILCVGVGHLFSGAPLAHSSTGAAGTNNTTSTQTNTSKNSTVNVTGSAQTLLGLSLPAWALFGAVAIVAAALVLVAVPAVGLLLRSGRTPKAGAAAAAAAAAGADLEHAASALESGADPRSVILALYASLLAHLEPMVGDLDPSTPEEIRSHHLVRLGIRPAAAHALTRLFEEARYSSHPIDAAKAARATVVLRAAEADLVRRPDGP